MTDYLDELLEQVEQDEEDGFLQWRRPNRAVYAEAGRDDATDGGDETRWRAEGAEAAQEQALSQPVERLRQGPLPVEQMERMCRGPLPVERMERLYRGPLPVEQMEQMHRERAPVVLIQQMEQLRRAVRQGQEQLRRRNTAAQAAVQPGAVGGRYGVSLPARRAADYAAAVDAAFQRDARRYDGPLGLL